MSTESEKEVSSAKAFIGTKKGDDRTQFTIDTSIEGTTQAI